MNTPANIAELIKAQGGIISAAAALEQGFSYEALRRALRRGDIAQMSRGYYTLPGSFDDELFLLQARYQRGIYSYLTALYLHGLSDRVPLLYDLTFPAHYNAHRIDSTIVRVHFDRPELYEQFTQQIKSSAGNEVRAYTTERTLCDIVRPNAKVDPSLISDAYKRWAKSPDKDIFAITKCSQLVGVDDKVRSYLEVLL